MRLDIEIQFTYVCASVMHAVPERCVFVPVCRVNLFSPLGRCTVNHERQEEEGGGSNDRYVAWH